MGALYFITGWAGRGDGALDLTFEYDATALAEEVLFLPAGGMSSAVQWHRIADDKRAWTTKALRIDAYGKILSKQSLDSQDGNDVMTMTLQLCDEDTNNLFLNFSLVNSLATVP